MCLVNKLVIGQGGEGVGILGFYDNQCYFITLSEGFTKVSRKARCHVNIESLDVPYQVEDQSKKQERHVCNV